MIDFKITLQAARVNANKTQAEAAAELGVSVFTLMNWESGKTKNIPITKFRKLCAIYGVPEQFVFLPEQSS